MEDLVGRRLAGYEIVKWLGEGAIDVVYKAYQPSLDRHVAIKILRPELSQNAAALEAYRRAVLAVARLNHPNILHINDMQVEGEFHYVVMDYAEGGSLRQLLQAGPMPKKAAVDLASGIASAVAYAHERGVVHGALRPENILLDADGKPLVSDFAVGAALMAVDPDLQIGKPEYMAPEQAHGVPANTHTDIYGLGLILYEMLTGQPPFKAPTSLATLYKQVNEPAPKLSAYGVDAPDIQKVLDRLLAKAPQYRFRSAEAVVSALRNPDAVSELAYKDRTTPPAMQPAFIPPQSPPTPPARRKSREESAPPPPRRIPRAFIIGSGVVSLVLVAVIVGMILALANQGRNIPVATATPSAPAVAVADTATPTATQTATVTATYTPEPTAAETATVTITPTASGHAFAGGVIPTSTATPTAMPTMTPTILPSPTAVPTNTAAPPTAAPTPTLSPQPTATSTGEATPTIEAPTPTPVPPPVSIAGHIAYPLLNPGNGQVDVWVAAADGSNRYQLSPCMRQPDIFASGRVLANGQGCSTDSLWAINLDGSERREMSKHPEDEHPTWSPDGGSIAYSSTQQGDGQSRIYIHPTGGEPPQSPPAIPLGGTGVLGRFPVWLPNGEIAYNGCDYGFGTGGNCGLWVVGSGGGQPRRLTTDAADRAVDAFGSTLVFMSTRDGNWEIYRINIDGSGLLRLTDNGSNDGLPTWSPDGTAVAFLSDRDGQWAVWAMAPDGSGQHKLFDLNGAAGSDWTEERLSWGP